MIWSVGGEVINNSVENSNLYRSISDNLCVK
jgi:hypothetical protein